MATTRTARARITVAVDSAEECHAIEEWFARLCSELTRVSDDQGCGCCVNNWEVEGPQAAIDAIPDGLREWKPPGTGGAS